MFQKCIMKFFHMIKLNYIYSYYGYTLKQSRIIHYEKDKWSEVAQSCPTLCNPMDCSLPGSSLHGIFQAIVLEWIAISFSRGSSQPRDWTWVSRFVDRCFPIWAMRKIKRIQIKNEFFQILVWVLKKVSLFVKRFYSSVCKMKRLIY